MRKDCQKGFTIVELIIVVLIISIIAVIAIPNFTASLRAANEGSAISSLRTLHSANATYQSTSDDGEFAPTFVDLRNAGLIDSVLGNAETTAKSGYLYTYFRNPVGANAAVFDIGARPVSFAGFSSTGTRSFVVTESGFIYYNLTDTPPLVDDNTRVVSNGLPLNN